MKKQQIILATLLTLSFCLAFNLSISASIVKPGLVSPNDDIVTNDSKPTFEWNLVDNADNYRLVIDNDDDWKDSNIYENLYDNSTSKVEIENKLLDGDYWWRVIAENISEENRSDVRTFEIDTVPPTISNVRVSGVDESSAAILWDVDEPNTAVVKYGKNDSYGSSKSGTGSVVLEGLTEGTTYHYKIEVTDDASNPSTYGDNTFHTLALPESSVDNLDGYWFVTDNVEITATASDEDGSVENVMLRYRFRENTSADWSDWENYGWGYQESDNWVWNFTSPENDGFYEVYTKALDNQNLSESTSGADENLGFDTSNPSVLSIQIDEDSAVTTHPLVDIDITAEDETSGLDKMRFRIDDGEWGDWKSFENTDNHYFLPPYGERTIYVQVKDSAGLSSTSKTDSILLENATFTKDVGTIGENENKLANLSDWGLVVKEIKLCAKDEVSSAEVGLRVENEKPAEIPSEKPAPLVNSYFRIEVNCEDQKLKQIDILFDIEKSWLENNGVNPDDIEVWRFENKWKKVEVEMLGENSTHVTYKATSPNLSWFAIAKKTGNWIIWIVIIIIAGAGGVLFYLFGWPELESYLESKGSSGRGLPS